MYRSIPAEVFKETIQMLKGGGPVPRTISCLPIKFTNISLAKARLMGLSDRQYQILSSKIKQGANEAVLLMARRVAVGTKLDGLVRTGDLVLSVDDVPVVRPFEVEEAIRGKTSFRLVARNSALSVMNASFFGAV